MNGNTKVEVRVDAYTRVCLTAIAVLLTVTVLGLWCQGVPSLAPAWADGPAATGDNKFGDTNARIAAQLEATRAIDGKLDELLKLLTSGQVKVQVVQDEKAGGGNGQQPKGK